MADPVHAFDADGTPSPGAKAALDGKSDVGHTHAWADVTGKPATFPPPAHSHEWSDVTGKPATFPPTVGSTATTAAPGNHTHTWAQISGKPTEFPPATHNHDDRYVTQDQASAAAPWVSVITLVTNGGTGANQSGGSVDVQFPPGRFTSPPAVLVTKQSGGAARAYAYAMDITATGCRIGMYDPAQGNAPTPVEIPIAVAAYPV